MVFERVKFQGSFGDLEPHIDAMTMELHQEKHHETYRMKVNTALEGVDHSYTKIEEVLRNLDSIPEDKRTVIRNNGGGLANHNLFFSTISNKQSSMPDKVGSLIEQLGGYDKFVADFTEKATTLFGSGWVFLSVDENNENPHIEQLPLQDSPHMHNHKPILGLDVWEHAYYLKYQNRRPEYIEHFFEIIDWEKVQEEWDKIA